jgi:hypothetical protein
MDYIGGAAGLLLMGVSMDAIGAEGLVFVIAAAAAASFIFLLSLRRVDPRGRRRPARRMTNRR